MSTTTSYQVVEQHWFLFCVDQVDVEIPLAGKAYEIRETLRRYIRQSRAEQHAAGLAEGSWSRHGPIRAMFKEVDDEQQHA